MERALAGHRKRWKRKQEYGRFGPRTYGALFSLLSDDELRYLILGWTEGRWEPIATKVLERELPEPKTCDCTLDLSHCE